MLLVSFLFLLGRRCCGCLQRTGCYPQHNFSSHCKHWLPWACQVSMEKCNWYLFHLTESRIFDINIKFISKYGKSLFKSIWLCVLILCKSRNFWFCAKAETFCNKNTRCCDLIVSESTQNGVNVTWNEWKRWNFPATMSYNSTWSFRCRRSTFQPSKSLPAIMTRNYFKTLTFNVPKP